MRIILMMIKLQRLLYQILPNIDFGLEYIWQVTSILWAFISVPTWCQYTSITSQRGRSEGHSSQVLFCWHAKQKDVQRQHAIQNDWLILKRYTSWQSSMNRYWYTYIKSSHSVRFWMWVSSEYSIMYFHFLSLLQKMTNVGASLKYSSVSQLCV